MLPTSHMDPKKLLQTSRTMLDDQYAHMEDYCQAQTIVNNLILSSQQKGKSSSQTTTTSQRHNHGNNHDLLLQSLCHLKISLQKVKEDRKSWQLLVASLSHNNDDDDSDNEHDTASSNSKQKYIQLLLEQHLALSERALQTIYQPYHTNGIIATGRVGNGNRRHEANTLALATLRASAARVLDTLHALLS